MRTPTTEVVDSELGGTQRLYEFANGYGASIVCHKYSYGGEEGKWELAVLLGGSLCYDTPITSDVVGHLSEDEVDKLLTQIEQLPAPNTTEVRFIYCEQTRKWEVHVSNAANGVEARQAFNAVLITMRDAVPEVESNRAERLGESTTYRIIIGQ